ncbi:hypothetical protein C0J52_25630 [Blattella germanica]|nr:hypothetical protein C0J52_25630 [Blattella germanica]
MSTLSNSGLMVNMEPNNVTLAMNIGFIGAGNMAKAIGEGLLHSGAIKASQLYVSAPTERNLGSWKELGANTTNKNGYVVEKSDIIFIAVKPHILDSAVEDIKNTLSNNFNSKLFISILAGTTLETLEEQDSELEGIFQEKRKTNSILEFWNTVPEKQLENLVSCAYKILCLFGSTYICEMTFSKIKFIKGKHRSHLTNVNLENLLRICVANQPARIDKIVEESSRVRSSTSQQ